MIGPIEEFLSRDHGRLDELLGRADTGRGPIDMDAYEGFRAGLLRHIAMEEKILLPFARARRGGEPLPMAAALRADHGRIAKLLVPTPTRALIDTIRMALAEHNAIEEGPGGLYAACDALSDGEAATLLARLAAQPAPPLAPHYDGPLLGRR